MNIIIFHKVCKNHQTRSITEKYLFIYFCAHIILNILHIFSYLRLSRNIFESVTKTFVKKQDDMQKKLSRIKYIRTSLHISWTSFDVPSELMFCVASKTQTNKTSKPKQHLHAKKRIKISVTLNQNSEIFLHVFYY